MKMLFPRNESSHSMIKRNPEFYKVVKTQTERFRKSAIPSMIRMLNSYQKRKNDTLKKIATMPVNNEDIAKKSTKSRLFEIMLT